MTGYLSNLIQTLALKDIDSKLHLWIWTLYFTVI